LENNTDGLRFISTDWYVAEFDIRTALLSPIRDVRPDIKRIRVIKRPCLRFKSMTTADTAICEGSI
jgi:hypothetical protein